MAALFLLDAWLHADLQGRLETPSAESTRQTAASGRVPADHVQQTPGVRGLCFVAINPNLHCEGQLLTLLAAWLSG